MPLFSIIINNYNYGRFLDTAIASVQAQSFRDFELIVVDDGSNDDSILITRKYADRIKLIQTERLGQALACQRALRDATGTYVYFLDADDEARPDLLQCAAEHLAGNPCKLQFRLEPMNATGVAIGKPFPKYPKDSVQGGGDARAAHIDSILKRGFDVSPPTSGNIFKTELFRYIDDIDYERAIDGIPLLLAPFVGNVVTIDRVLARYRIHESNDSGFVRPTPHKFMVERDRFAARYRHLQRLNEKYRLGDYRFGDPKTKFRYYDRDLMMKLCAGDPPSMDEITKFVRAHVKERGLSIRTAGLIAWVCVIKFGPRSLSRVVFAMRANPWSELNTLRGFFGQLFWSDQRALASGKASA